MGADGLDVWDMLRGVSFIVPSVMPVTCGRRLHRPSTNAATAGFSGKMNFLGTRIVMDVGANRISPPTSPIVPCVATVKTVAAHHLRLRRSSSQRRRAPIARRRWPPLRGTLAQIGGRSLLHSRGYLPRVGDTPTVMCRHRLKLSTTMVILILVAPSRGALPDQVEWNSGGYAETMPITLRFSRL